MKEAAIQLLAETLIVKHRAAQANGGAGAHAGEKASC